MSLVIFKVNLKDGRGKKFILEAIILWESLTCSTSFSSWKKAYNIMQSHC